MAAPVDHRKYVRVPLTVTGAIHLEGESGNPIPCEIVDISLGGAFLHCTAPIEIGQVILVEIHFETNTTLTAKVVHDAEDTQKAFRIPEKSIVRWVRGSSKSGFGIEFVKLGEAKRVYLNRVVEAFSRSKGK